MNKITLSIDIPKGEAITVYVDGKPCEAPSFTVNCKFRLRLEQYRLSAVEGSEKKNFLMMLAMLFARGGRITYGSEVSTPDRAVWEAECEALADGEIRISLARQNDGNVLFDVVSDQVTFSDTTSERVVGSEEKRRWLGYILPLAIPMSLFAIAMIVLIWVGTQDSEPGFMTDLTRIIFTVLPAFVIVYIWFMTLKPLIAAKKPYDEEKQTRRYEIMATVLNILAAIYAAVAAAILLLPAIWSIDWFFISPMPCALVFIIVIAIAQNMNDNAGFERGGAKEAAEKMKRAIKRAVIAFAAVIVCELIGVFALGG